MPSPSTTSFALLHAGPSRAASLTSYVIFFTTAVSVRSSGGLRTILRALRRVPHPRRAGHRNPPDRSRLRPAPARVPALCEDVRLHLQPRAWHLPLRELIARLLCRRCRTADDRAKYSDRPCRNAARGFDSTVKGSKTMKFILMMGMKTTREHVKGIMTWPQEDIQAHIAFMMTFNKELKGPANSSPPKGWPGRTRPSSCAPARTARPSPTASSPKPRSSSPATGSSTSRPPERAYQIAARASAAPGHRRRAAQHADRSAAGDERAAEESCDSDCRTPASSTCCASSRRRCSAPSSAASAISPPPRTPSRRRSSPRPRNGRTRACPTIRAAGSFRSRSRRMTDHIRSEIARRRRETAAAMAAGYVIPAPDTASSSR